MTYRDRGPAFTGLTVLLALCLILTPVLTSMASAQGTQDTCESGLADAEKLYYSGRFDAAIEMATNCLDKPELTKNVKLKAYKLIGLASIAKDYRDEAKEAIQKLLDLVPSYEPDPIQDPPTFTSMVQEIRKEIEAERKQAVKEAEEMVKKEPVAPPPLTQRITPVEEGGRPLWLYIGGGALVAGGLVAALALSGGGGGGDGDGNGNGPDPTEPLPDPPQFP